MAHEPAFVQALKGKNEPGLIFAGDTCAAAITEKDGNLFIWGSGPALGLGKSKQHSNRPFLVSSLRTLRVVTMSIGKYHASYIILYIS